jgi:hypothetical protein
MESQMNTPKTIATLIFHGPHDSKFCRRAAARLAKAHGGKTGYLSFWNGRRNAWFSPETVGTAVYRVIVPVANYEAAEADARALVQPGFRFTHSWSHWGKL